jgi:gamma-glutamyltranspeptidase / glutathione hydrolase
MTTTNTWQRVPQRGPTYGRHGAVAADHPQAALSAMSMLQKGGSAGDALIAAAAVNAVTKPYATQLGGDAFALIFRRQTNEVECLNAGGLAPARATLEEYGGVIPRSGPRSCTVPGFVDALLELYKGYATLPLATLLAPALALADEGFPVSSRLSTLMEILPRLSGAENAELRRVFLRDALTPYQPGETLRQPELAATFRRIIEDEREGFYEGEVAELIGKAMAEHGGLVSAGDLKAETAHWHEPIRTTYAGCEIYEQALPSQGLILLEALNIVENFPLADWGPGSADTNHVMIEAIKLAFADRRRYAADPLVESVPIETLLSKQHAALRAGEIDLARTKQHEAAALRGDTTSFVVADENTAIAFIQTVYSAWGSRFMVPGTGVLMTNRLSGFSADPANPNHLAPGKRTVHTLNNFLVLRDGQLVVGGGTPGADFQVQTNLQTIVGTLDWHLDLQAAIDMPRWVGLQGAELAIERRFPDEVLVGLSARGHQLKLLEDWPYRVRTPNGDMTFACSQVIGSLPDGGWAVASDTRGEGVALAI